MTTLENPLPALAGFTLAAAPSPAPPEPGVKSAPPWAHGLRERMPGGHEQPQLLPDSSPQSHEGQCFLSASPYSALLLLSAFHRLPALLRRQMWAAQHGSWCHPWRCVHVHPQRAGWGETEGEQKTLGSLPRSSDSAWLSAALARGSVCHTRGDLADCFKFPMPHEPAYMIYWHKHVTFYILELQSTQTNSIEVPFQGALKTLWQLFLKAMILLDRYFYWVKTPILNYCHVFTPTKEGKKPISNKLNYGREEGKGCYLKCWE